MPNTSVYNENTMLSNEITRDTSRPRNLDAFISAMNTLKCESIKHHMLSLSDELYNEVLSVINRALLLNIEHKVSFRTCDFPDTNFTQRIYLLEAELRKLGFYTELKHPSSNSPMHIVVGWNVDRLSWVCL